MRLQVTPACGAMEGAPILVKARAGEAIFARIRPRLARFQTIRSNLCMERRGVLGGGSLKAVDV